MTSKYRLPTFAIDLAPPASFRPLPSAQVVLPKLPRSHPSCYTKPARTCPRTPSRVGFLLALVRFSDRFSGQSQPRRASAAKFASSTLDARRVSRNQGQMSPKPRELIEGPPRNGTDRRTSAEYRTRPGGDRRQGPSARRARALPAGISSSQEFGPLPTWTGTAETLQAARLAHHLAAPLCRTG